MSTGNTEPNVVTDVTKEPIEINPGVTGSLITTVTKTDIDNDGIFDIVETSKIQTDSLGNVVDSSIQIQSLDVNANILQDIQVVPAGTGAQVLVDEIDALKNQINCSSLHHMGTMNDYLALFQKAQQYINTVGDKNITLILDTTTLDNFANQAQIYAQMFEEVQIQFERISTVDETDVLTRIRDDLTKIAEMYTAINKFKATITATSLLQIPDSIKNVAEDLQSVITTMNCALPYVEYFVNDTTVLSPEQMANAELNDIDKAAIQAAINALDIWLDLVVNEANVTMNGNAYIQAFKDKIASFGSLNTRLTNATTALRARLDAWLAGDFSNPNSGGMGDI